MKKYLLYLIIAILVTFAFGEKYEYYVSKDGAINTISSTKKSEMPIHIVLNATPIKKNYNAGDELVIDVCYEYLTDHHSYVPEDTLEVGVYGPSSKQFKSRNDVEIELLAQEKGYLTDQNKTFKTKYKIKYLQKANYTVLGEGYFIIGGKTFTGIIQDNKNPDNLLKLYKNFKVQESFSFIPWDKTYDDNEVDKEINYDREETNKKDNNKYNQNRTPYPLLLGSKIRIPRDEL